MRWSAGSWVRFWLKEDGQYDYAEDTGNYYAVNELMVWKPDVATLDLIINYRHRTNPISMGGNRRPGRASPVRSRGTGGHLEEPSCSWIQRTCCAAGPSTSACPDRASPMQ